MLREKGNTWSLMAATSKRRREAELTRGETEQAQGNGGWDSGGRVGGSGRAGKFPVASHKKEDFPTVAD